jgi:hypothetical protein
MLFEVSLLLACKVFPMAFRYHECLPKTYIFLVLYISNEGYFRERSLIIVRSPFRIVLVDGRS